MFTTDKRHLREIHQNTLLKRMFILKKYKINT